MPFLPARPSGEHLRKQAKRLARADSVRLSEAQHVLAQRYGFANWPALMRHVAAAEREGRAATLLEAVRAGEVDAVRALLAAGANPREGDGGEQPLHAAARRGPLAIVELLIAAGALEWEADAKGRTPLMIAKRSRARGRAAIVSLLDRPSTNDPSFRAAIGAVQRGDVAALTRLLDAEPRLLRERVTEPAAYHQTSRHQYFLDPKLLWFIANNPTLVPRIPANIVDVARVMIARGADAADLDYTLELVMTSAAAREQGHQAALMGALVESGAVASAQAVAAAAAHHELGALRALIDGGHPLTLEIAAALGDVGAVRTRLPSAEREAVQTAFALAVINGQTEAARILLDAGADVDAYVPVHAHSTPLHQAAVNDDVATIELLLAHDARLDARDTLWNATPLEWAIHEAKPAARTALERAERKAPRSDPRHG